MRKFDVINRGFSGYNTDWAIPVLKHVSVIVEVFSSMKAQQELARLLVDYHEKRLSYAVADCPPYDHLAWM